MARAYPILAPIKELRHTLSELKLNALEVSGDGRNRTSLFPFASKTSRNQPSTTKFIFGPSKWLRSLIKPTSGYGLAYIDYSQQEVGIAAALSGDKLLQDAYQSGDSYLAFAVHADAVPSDATKATHSTVRDQYKQCMLATQYGMGEESLAVRIGKAPIDARHLLGAHRGLYARYWRWSDGALTTAQLNGVLCTRYGWPIHVTADTKERTLRNFPMQGNGAEMLRLAICYMTEAGIKVCAPVNGCGANPLSRQIRRSKWHENVANHHVAPALVVRWQLHTCARVTTAVVPGAHQVLLYVSHRNLIK